MRVPLEQVPLALADVPAEPALVADDDRMKLVIIQPTPFCNIDCRYCYLPNRNDRRVISDETIRRIGERVFETPRLSDVVSFLWHAGEPLVMPVSFYERAFEILEATNADRRPTKQSIHTNGTLLTQEWCDFFKRRNVNVGVSLDGPAFLHNRMRVTRSGAGTHDRVMRGIRLLQENHIPFYIIGVLTREHLDHADLIYNFFRDEGIVRIGFNVEEQEGAHTTSSMTDAAAEARYRAFMKRMLERVSDASGEVRVREIEELRNYLLFDPDAGAGRNLQAEALRMVTIDWEGNFSTFSPELLGLRNDTYGDFLFGNVHRDSFEAALWSEKFRLVSNDIAAGIDACRRTCSYFPLCGGGAPVNKFDENGSFRSTETMWCRLNRKALIDLVLPDTEMRLGLATASC